MRAQERGGEMGGGGGRKCAYMSLEISPSTILSFVDSTSSASGSEVIPMP